MKTTEETNARIAEIGQRLDSRGYYRSEKWFDPTNDIRFLLDELRRRDSEQPPVESYSKEEWISVEERLPTSAQEDKPNIPCWVNTKHYGTMALTWNHYYLDWDSADEDDHSGYADDVTHWMPLPEPPHFAFTALLNKEK